MPSLDDPFPRSSHLMNGRRVRLSDLVDAQLLTAGQELSFERRRAGEVHRAVVTDSGWIKLADGQEFDTPSGAATAITSGAIDGWNAWRVGPNGPYLAQLRRQLLESLATASTPPGTASPGEESANEAAVRRFKYLNDAWQRAGAGTLIELTVRDLIRFWGLHERDRAANQQIEADLANHGLTSVPDFRAVNLDSTVRLVHPPSPDEDQAPLTVDSRTSIIRTEVIEEDSIDIGLTIGNLLPDDQSLVSVSPSATFEQAITTMLLNDFSQLAVLAGPRALRGAVTWKSIAHARHANSAATLSSAIVPARDFSYDTRLLDVLDTLQKEEFIFVRAYDGQVSGIITAADVVRTYDALPFS